jgi:polysaccharide pyruvyl transferase WcaK-like protein
MLNILIVGGAGWRNAGDEALLRASVQVCHELAPDARLLLAANNQDVATDTLQGFAVEFVPSPRVAFFRNDASYTGADKIFCARWNVLRNALVGQDPDEARDRIRSSPVLAFIDRVAAEQFYSALASSDVLLVHGGGILTSATRSRLWEQALTVEIAARLGKRILLRSQQLGPYADLEDRMRIRTILQSAHYVTTRDLNQSSREAARIDPHCLVRDQVDDALLLKTDAGSEHAALAKYGLRKGQYICVGYRSNSSVGIDDSCFLKTANVARLAQGQYGLPLVLLPQMPGDLSGLQHLGGLLEDRARVIQPIDPLLDVIAIASHARLMIACPHHSLIFALRGAVPILSPVMGSYYLFKNVGSMRFFELDDFVLDLSQPMSVITAQVCEKLKFIISSEQRLRSRIQDQVKQRCVDALRNDEQEFAKCLQPMMTPCVRSDSSARPLGAAIPQTLETRRTSQISS